MYGGEYLQRATDTICDLQSERFLLRSFFSHTRCDDATAKAAERAKSAAAAFVEPPVSSSLCLSDDGVDEEASGVLFHDKIRLLKKSIQEQRVAFEERWREEDTREKSGGVESRPLPPGAECAVNIPQEHNNDAEKTFAMMTSVTPGRENGRHDVCDDGNAVMDLTASPAVVVVVDSPSSLVEHHDATTMTADVCSGPPGLSAAAFCSVDHSANVFSGVASVNDSSTSDDRGGDAGLVGQNDDAQQSHSLNKKMKAKKKKVQLVAAATSSTEAQKKPIRSFFRPHQNIFLTSASTESADSTKLQDFRKSQSVSGNRNTKRAKTLKGQTLYAPAMCCGSRRSAREGSLQQLSTSCFDNKTRPRARDDGCGVRNMAHKALEENALLTKRDCGLGQHVGRGGDDTILVSRRSVSLENPRDQSIHFFSGGDSTRSGGKRKTTVLTQATGAPGWDGLSRSRSRSPNFMHAWVQRDMASSTSTCGACSSPALLPEQREKKKMTFEDDAAARQRRCLLRQIRLIDAEINLVEQVPWSRSLRSNTCSSFALNAEKAKLVSLRKQYEVELERVTRCGLRQAAQPPSSSSSSFMASSSAQPSSLFVVTPRHGPSVYEKVLQQQHEEAQRKESKRRCVKWGSEKPYPTRSSVECGDLFFPPPSSIVAAKGGEIKRKDKMLNNRSFFSSSFCHKEHSATSDDLQINEEPKVVEVISGQPVRGSMGGRRSISTDAERMPAGYVYTALSSSSLQHGGEASKKDAAGVAGFADFSDRSHDGDGVPFYWKMAQERRRLGMNSGKTRNKSVSLSSCSSFLPSPDIVKQQPLKACGRGVAYGSGERDVELCADVAAEQYYCTEYGVERDVSERPQRVTSCGGRGTRRITGRGGYGRDSFLSSFAWKPNKSTNQKHRQNGEISPTASSNLRLERRKSFSVGSSQRGGVRGRSELCYRLQAPTLTEGVTNVDLNSLHHYQDSAEYANKIAKVGNDVPRCLDSRAKPYDNVRYLNKHRLVAYKCDAKFSEQQQRENSEVSELSFLSPEKRTLWCGGGSDFQRADNDVNRRRRVVQPAVAAVPLAQDGCAEINGRRGFSGYLAGARNDGMGFSFSQKCESPPAREYTPPPPELSQSLSLAACNSYARLSEQKECNGNFLFTSTQCDLKNAGSHRASEHQRERRGSNALEGQTPEYVGQMQLGEKQLISDTPSKTSDIHVSPLTEYSRSMSPVAPLSVEVTALDQRGSNITESKRAVCREESQHKQYSFKYAPPPPLNLLLTHGGKKLVGRDGGCTIASSLNATQLSFDSRRISNIDYEFQNEPSISSDFFITQRTGLNCANGITLRQLFEHEHPSAISLSLEGKDEYGAGLTDVLLDRINKMRTEMGLTGS